MALPFPLAWAGAILTTALHPRCEIWQGRLMVKDVGSSIPAEQVAQWLRTQGFPFEMAVARALRRAGISDIAQSAYFTDPDEGKSREIDVIARRDCAVDAALIVTAALVVECKVALKPWVLFVDPSRRDSTAPSFQRITTQLGQRWLRTLEFRSDVRRLPMMQSGPRRGYALTTARLLADSSRDKTPDHAYEGLVGATKAATALAASMEQRSCAILLPVLVLRGQLFEAWLDADQILQVQAVERGQVLWQSPTSGAGPVIVDVVTESEIDSFAAEAAETIEALATTTADEARRAADADQHTRWSGVTVSVQP